MISFDLKQILIQDCIFIKKYLRVIQYIYIYIYIYMIKHFQY